MTAAYFEIMRLLGSWGPPAARPRAPEARSGQAAPLRAVCTLGPVEGYSNRVEDREREITLVLTLLLE